MKIFIWKLQLKLSRLLTNLGTPHVVAKILTGVHKKERHYAHQYDKGGWEYVMKLY